jgi:hypothetical protein
MPDERLERARSEATRDIDDRVAEAQPRGKMEETLFMLAELVRQGKHKDNPEILQQFGQVAGIVSLFVGLTRRETMEWALNAAVQKVTGLDTIRYGPRPAGR